MTDNLITQALNELRLFTEAVDALVHTVDQIAIDPDVLGAALGAELDLESDAAEDDAAGKA